MKNFKNIFYFLNFKINNFIDKIKYWIILKKKLITLVNRK